MIHRHIFEISVTVKSSFVIHADSKQGSKSKCSIYTIVGINESFKAKLNTFT